MGLINSKLQKLYLKQYEKSCLTLDEFIAYATAYGTSAPKTILILSLKRNIDGYISIDHFTLMPHFGPEEDFKEVTLSKSYFNKKSEDRVFEHRKISEYGITWIAAYSSHRKHNKIIQDLFNKSPRYKHKLYFK